MRSGILLEEPEIKALIAKAYDVPVKDVIRTKYSYMVLDAKAREIINNELPTEA